MLTSTTKCTALLFPLSMGPNTFALTSAMRGSRKFCKRGSNSDNAFFDEGREDPNSAKRGPSSRHLNGVWLAGRRWPNIVCWLGSFVIFQGIWTSIAKNSYFCDFSGEGGVCCCILEVPGPDRTVFLWGSLIWGYTVKTCKVQNQPFVNLKKNATHDIFSCVFGWQLVFACYVLCVLTGY